MSRPRSRWIAKLLLALGGIVLALGVAEVGLRVARRWSPRVHALLYSPAVTTRFDELRTTEELLAASAFGYHPLGSTPGYILNSRGFRTVEYTEAKPPGTIRAIALGDSFTFDSSSVPIAQMWHQVAGAELAAKLGRPVEVLNLSAPGVGPRFLLRLWEVEGRRLDPDLVLLGFFVGNDFTDEGAEPLGRSFESGLARWSATYRLLRNLARLRRQRAAPEFAPARPAGGAAAAATAGGYEFPDYAATYDPNVPTFDEANFVRIERDRLGFIAGLEEPRFGELVDEAAAVVERLARDVEARGAEFVVMLIPDEVQIDDALRARAIARPDAGAPPIRFDVDRPQRRFAEILAARRIHFIDLLPRFRAGARQERLYKLRDTHWNAAGNRLAGQALAEYVLAQGLAPAGD